MPHESAGTRRNSRYGRPEASCPAISSSSSHARQSSILSCLPELVTEPDAALFPRAGRGAEGEDPPVRRQRGEVPRGGQRPVSLVEAERHLEEAAAEGREPERPPPRRHYGHAVRDRHALDALARTEPRLDQVAAAAVEADHPAVRREERQAVAERDGGRERLAACEASVLERARSDGDREQATIRDGVADAAVGALRDDALAELERL